MVSALATASGSFTETQLRIFKDRYALRAPEDPTKQIEDSPKQMWERVAAWGSQSETDRSWKGKFYEILEDFRFLPGGRILHAAGMDAKLTAMNCFVLPSPEDSRAGIMKSLNWWIETQARGGGVGINMSSLRPSGEVVKGVNGTSSGPLLWMQLFTTATKDVVIQGGTRRGAAMIMLSDSHPDVINFIKAKKTPGVLEGANLSVTLSDAFMAALENDLNWDLHWGGKVYQTISAKELWGHIVEAAWSSGEPGCFWIDRANSERNLWYLENMAFICSNPCLLGSTRMLTQDGLRTISSINTTSFFTPDGWSFGKAWHTGKKDVVQILLSNGQRIITTPDHKIVVGEQKIEAQSLLGEALEPFLGNGDWIGDNSWDDKDLVRFGFIQGDGHRQQDGGFYVNIGAKDADVEPLFEGYKSHGDKQFSRYIAKNDQLAQEAARFGLDLQPLTERRLPETVFGLSPDALCLFLRGLFSANGCVHQSVKRISFKTTCLDLVTDLQQLLLALGYRSNITTNKPQAIKWPNGTYTSKTSYDLNIAGSYISRFRKQIGFIQRYKQQRLDEVESPQGHRVNPTVIAVESVGIADVYDFTVEATSHIGWAAGLAVSNCSEIPLPAFGSCLLGTINVSAFIKYGQIAWDDLKKTTWRAVRLLDNVIDLSYYPLPEYEQHQKTVRQQGLGITGLADALIKLKMSYGSNTSISFTDELYKTVAEEAYRESIRLAKDRGAFSLCDPEKHSEATLVKRMPEDIRAGIKRYGIRNSYLTAQQPSGTQSLLAGVNSGIEPVFDFEAIRKDRTGAYMPTSEATTIWSSFNGNKRPDYFVSANDLAPEQHVLVQAAAQRWVDQAISKTVNAPKDYTVDQVDTLYRFAYAQNLRTIAFYRDGSRQEQVLYHKNGNSNALDVGTSITSLRTKLPLERNSITHRFQVGEQEGYITVGLYDDGRPGELFITMSKGGSTMRGLMDSFATAISIGLQHGVDFDYLVTKFSGSKFEPAGMTMNKDIPHASSVIDYVFRWMGIRFGNGVIILNKNHGAICPECGEGMTSAEGCELCESCGYSRCG